MKPCGFTTLERWLGGWIPLGIYSLLIVQGALLSPENFPRFAAHWDDGLVHEVEYFFLFLFAVNAFQTSTRAWIQNFPIGFGFGYCAALGALTECAQFFVPGRVPQMKDFIVDLLGSSAALSLHVFLRRARRSALS